MYVQSINIYIYIYIYIFFFFFFFSLIKWTPRTLSYIFLLILLLERLSLTSISNTIPQIDKLCQYRLLFWLCALVHFWRHVKPIYCICNFLVSVLVWEVKLNLLNIINIPLPQLQLLLLQFPPPHQSIHNPWHRVLVQPQDKVLDVALCQQSLIHWR